MVTVQETPFSENPSEVSHWIIYPDTINNALMSWNCFFSFIGYLLFGVIMYASYKEQILRKHVHDVFLILIFVFITDVIELRMHLHFILDLQYRGKYYGDRMFIPISVAACTIPTHLFFVHYLITIRRFISTVCGKTVPVFFVYISLGIVFVVKASLLAAAFIFGKSLTISKMFCTRSYVIERTFVPTIIIWIATVTIAPTLSAVDIVKGILKKKQCLGVSAFILVSSLAMAVFTALRHEDYLSACFDHPAIIVSQKIHDIQFLFLCMLAIIIVRDVRDAVFTTFLRCIYSDIIANDVLRAGLSVNGKSAS